MPATGVCGRCDVVPTGTIKAPVPLISNSARGIEGPLEAVVLILVKPLRNMVKLFLLLLSPKPLPMAINISVGSKLSLGAAYAGTFAPIPSEINHVVESWDASVAYRLLVYGMRKPLPRPL